MATLPILQAGFFSSCNQPDKGVDKKLNVPALADPEKKTNHFIVITHFPPQSDILFVVFCCFFSDYSVKQRK